jgi:hypothetical protein
MGQQKLGASTSFERALCNRSASAIFLEEEQWKTISEQDEKNSRTPIRVEELARRRRLNFISAQNDLRVAPIPPMAELFFFAHSAIFARIFYRTAAITS